MPPITIVLVGIYIIEGILILAIFFVFVFFFELSSRGLNLPPRQFDCWVCSKARFLYCAKPFALK